MRFMYLPAFCLVGMGRVSGGLCSSVSLKDFERLNLLGYFKNNDSSDISIVLLDKI